MGGGRYRQLLAVPRGRGYGRGEAGAGIQIRHKQLFVIGRLEQGYHPVLNIRYHSGC